MSEICLHLELEPYLRQWLVHENEGTLPLSFPKLSTENRILEVYLITLPPNARPDMPGESTIPIEIPSFRYKPPQHYNYLPVGAKRELKKCIRNRFIIALWNDLQHFGFIGKRKDHLIYAWMENHGIEVNDTNYNTIAKIYQRQHMAYLARERYKKKSSKKKGK